MCLTITNTNGLSQNHLLNNTYKTQTQHNKFILFFYFNHSNQVKVILQVYCLEPKQKKSN